MIAVYTEDQGRIEDRRTEFAGGSAPALHSTIQANQSALNATLFALKLSKQHQQRLHILPMSTAAAVRAGPGRGSIPAPGSTQRTMAITMNPSLEKKLTGLTHFFSQEALWILLGFGVVARLIQYGSNRALRADEAVLALNLIRAC